MSALRRKERAVLLGDSLSGNAGLGAGSVPIVTWFGPDDSTPEDSFGRQLRARYAANGATGDAPVFYNGGNPGATTADLLSFLPVRVYPQNPTAVFLMIGTNDISGSVDLVTVSTPNVVAILSGLLANCPSLSPGRLFVISTWIRGDLWPDGQNGLDPAHDAFNAMLQAKAAAVGAQYIDVRTPSFAVLPTLNPTHLGTGVLTASGDGIHPTRMGARYLTQFVTNALTFDYSAVAT